MAVLKVDLDVLSNTIKTYEAEIQNIRATKQKISEALKALRASGWDSAASKEWFSLLDDEWLTNIEFQIRVLERLKDNLIIAQNEYTAVKAEQDRLASGL